ncbi:MAG TPA: glutamine--fructose-6-phosphate transaminase (isomerizing) [Planctomycetota bacterium]|nr:glutamine--fructose-6-phosphate transaminase (isomerizing) [Planctomycetota bacterium]
MCGIVGAVLREGSVLDGLLAGLRALEYRGYDSAGVAVGADGGVSIRRQAGRLEALEAVLADGALDGAQIGIGHTRWATHGPPTAINAHPHTDVGGHVALVHNGIIENYLELREELCEQGVEFVSETDTEVLAQLVGRELATGAALVDAVRRTLARVRGYYAIAALAIADDRSLVCARQGPPLCLGVVEGGAFLASDPLALVRHTQDLIFLEDGDVATLRPGFHAVVDEEGNEVLRAAVRVDLDEEQAGRGSYAHFMLKEIHEQPDVLARTAFDRIDEESGEVCFSEDGWDPDRLRAIERVQLLACGTARYACQVAAFQIEGLAGIPADVDYASEFRYRSPRLSPGTLALAISQSGETADTLAALRLARELGARAGAICNVPESTLVREADCFLMTRAGPEIGVASTKAFVSQIVTSYLLAVAIGCSRGELDADEGRALLKDLRLLRPRLAQLLSRETHERIADIADRHYQVKGFMFLGRGIHYPVALEGALKLKEISYMHAEGYPAGEMKHGPIALIEPGMTTVVIANKGPLAEKVRSNLEQVRARGGQVICVGSDPESLALADETIEVPETSPWLAPVLSVAPLQLLAYEVALRRGCDIDKPRNLAKSVTVE